MNSLIHLDVTFDPTTNVYHLSGIWSYVFIESVKTKIYVLNHSNHAIVLIKSAFGLSIANMIIAISGSIFCSTVVE
ncbi:hypothetical protein [Spiroplasma endosymbiont of Virgichneumon dumeticola]|uniref:hypothetical protein n=1 Tax=Spiroplasma endosymbiont of Virgichneumon dumeticola TaxID=3139323 RepID=UPI0035C914E3